MPLQQVMFDQSQPQRHSEDKNGLPSGLKQYGAILLIFALVCLVTAWFFNLSKGETLSFRIFPDKEGVHIPLIIPKENMVYLVVVKQNTKQLPANRGWSFVEITVKDKEDEALYSFGDEFWQAYGRDYEGYYWSEQKGRYQMKLNFPKKGDYFLEVSVDSNVADLSEPIDIFLLPKRASSLPFSVLGIFALIAGAIVYYLGIWQDSPQTDKYNWQ